MAELEMRMVDQPDPDAPEWSGKDVGVRRHHGGSWKWSWACLCGAWDENYPTRKEARESYRYHRKVCQARSGR